MVVAKNRKNNLSKLFFGLVLTLLFFFLFSSFTLGFVSPAKISGESSQTLLVPTSKNLTLVGGGITNDNMSINYSTNNWAAFYGNISGNIFLGDSSNTLLYSWNISNFSDSVVYASTSPISDWSDSNIRSTTLFDQSKFFFTGVNDNSTNTFNETETFISPSLSKSNTYYSRTMQNGVEGNFKTYSLFAIAENDFIWAVNVRDDDSSFIPGQTVDYQLLVPSTDSFTYNFYLELK